jgi:hypothetical protein
MRLTYYFLIAPSASLTQRLPQSSTRFLQDLATPVLWSGERYDRGPGPNDLAVMVKLLFLDTLYRQRSTDEAFSNVFPNFNVAESYFDGHWTMSLFTANSTMEDAIDEAISEGTIQRLIDSASGEVKEELAAYQRKAKGTSST